MKLVRILSGYNHLWAVKDDEKETDELSLLFRQWSNFDYLLDFFFANLDDLQGMHTQQELDKLNVCRDFLIQNGVFEQDSFIDFFEED